MKFDREISRPLKVIPDQDSVDSSDMSCLDQNSLKAMEQTWLGVQIKSNFGFMQWFIIPFLSCGTVIVGVYMNTQLTYMLQAKDMFNIPSEKIG
jgi:hypothetical protein